MALTPADAFSVLPSSLRDDLLKAFNEIVKNYRERKWEPSELNGGKLCEAAYTVVKGWLDGSQYPARAKKPNNFPQACLDLEKNYPSAANTRSARVLIPRVMIGLYDIRNNRGVGHAGADVDPNHMDATFVLYASKWLVAELARMVHRLNIEEATAIVDALIDREVAWVWAEGAKKRVLRVGLTWKQQTLVLLLSETTEVDEKDLFEWLEHPSLTNFRRDVLRQLHRARLVEYDANRRTISLLPPGVTEAEKLIASS
jgi:hypothetical protein